MAFDPCREWLGIAAVDLADPRKVLGLPPGMITADSVSTAAAARLDALAQVRPGPFAKAHAALVNRVEEARDQLLGEAAATPAPGLLFPVPPPPPALRPAPPPAPPVADDRLPMSEAISAGGDLSPAADLELPPGPAVVRPATASRRRRSPEGAGLLFGTIALLIAAVAVLASLASPRLFSTRQVAAKPPAKGHVGSRPSPAAFEAGRLQRPSPPPPPVGSRKQDTAPLPAERKPRLFLEESESMAARQRQAEEQAEREREAQRAAAEVRRQEELRAAEQRASAAQKEAEAERRAEAEMQAEREEAVERSLRVAYAALQRDEFDTAKRAIAAAGNQVGDDVEQATRVERWRLFASYAREFLTFRDQALAAANAGREYEVDGKKFAVIEVTPDTFIYRLAGRNVRVPRDAIDPKMMMAIVEAWFAADGRSANQLFLGAHWLSLSPPDTRRARAAWQIAGDGGENVAALMALLDDPVIRRAGGR